MESEKLLKGSHIHKDSEGEFVSPYIPTPETERRVLPKTDDNEEDGGNINLSHNSSALSSSRNTVELDNKEEY